MARQQKQLPVQTSALSTVDYRAQSNQNGLKVADLLTLQHTIGNRQVQRLVEQRIDNENENHKHLLQQMLVIFHPTEPVQGRNAFGAEKIQRTLSKRDKKIRAAVAQLVKDGKHDEALDLICKKYGFTGKNFEIKVVPAMADTWATTGGEIKAGAKQTLSIGKDLFDQDFTFILRTIGHEFQHLKQRNQKKPITNQKEREFLAWGWEALDTSVPSYSLAVAADHARKALEFYDAMPDERKEISSNKKKKKALEKLIKKAEAAAPP